MAFNVAKAFAEVPASRLTIVNGFVASDLGEAASFPVGIEATGLADALAQGHPLLGSLGPVASARDNPVYELNTAFMADGAMIRIGADAKTENPIHLRFINSGSTAFATATRVLVVVEEGASATILETHEGLDGLACQTNDVVEFVVGDGATVDHLRLNAEGRDTLALSTLTARLGPKVAFNTINVVAGGSASRHQVFVLFAGEGSKAQINGATALAARQHADATLLIDHAVPHCTSREVYKTILDGDSTGVFQGKIIVRPHAQKTDGGMKSDTLLLSDGATMNNKPELEIFADDVVCGHGATCGALDEDLLFYLKSRGLPQTDAERLLLQAFLGQVVETVAHEGLRDALVGLVEGWLAARG